MGAWEGGNDGAWEEEEGDVLGKFSEDVVATQLAPDSGSFGVLRPGTKSGTNLGNLPTLKIETLEKKRSGFMIFALWASFFVSVGFLYDSVDSRDSNIALPPAAAASSAYGATQSDLIGVANYQPFTTAAQSSIFGFAAAVTVLPPDIASTGNDGTNATALQWAGRNYPATKNIHGSTWEFTAEYTDNNGILLSGEEVRFEILAFICWDSCDASQNNWHAIFTEDAPAFNRKVHVRDRNEAGLPTNIRWDLFAYQEYTPSHQYVSVSVRYLNDPGNATAGYKVFAENSKGQFGSCGGDADGDGGVALDSCMRLTQNALVNEDYMRQNLALVSAIVTCLCTIVWVSLVRRSSPKGWNGWMLQQKWTLLMAVGVIMFQNPLQTIWLYFDFLDNQPRLNRAFESINGAGLVVVLLVATFWADSARHRVLSPLAFYGPKVVYMAALWVHFYLGLLAIYPVGQRDGGSFWAASVWCWPEGRTLLLVVAGTCRLVLAILGGFFYFYFLHCSFQFYRKVPYMLTRAEQLSFRSVVSTFSLFVFLEGLTVASRFGIALVVSIDDGDREASDLTRAASFFKFLFGQSLRSPFAMLYLAISVIIFEVAFLPASAMQLSKYKPQYVRLESDLGLHARQPLVVHGGDGKGGGDGHHYLHDLASATGGAGAAVAGAAVGAAATATTATATAAAAVASAISGGAVKGVGTVSAALDRPVFVVERARWLAAISAEAYECFSAKELAERPKDRMAEVAPLGCEVVAMIKEAPEANLHDTHCLIVRHKATRRLVVAFRGTISKKQMKTDIQGWRCQLNLDLFAERRKKESMCCRKRPISSPAPPADASATREDEAGGAGTALAEEGEGELPPLPLPQLSQAAGGSSKSGRSTSRSKAAKRGHMATEDDLPAFLLQLGGVLKLSVSEPSAEAAATAAARTQEGKESEDLDVLVMPGDGLEQAEEGRQASSSTAAKAKAYASVGGTAAAAAAAGNAAAQALRERAAALHAKRVASRRARALRGRVHFGFWSSYSTVRERVLAVVQTELLREPGQLYVTGHSLGGALATLAAYDLSLWLLPVVNARLGRGPESASTGHEHEQEIRLTMYNFGSPRVGDFFFVQRYNLTVPHSYRVICDGDVITGMPPKRLGYLHVGCAAIVDRTGSGSLLIDPSFLEARVKTSRALNVAAHLLGPYMAAIDGCLYPLETTEEILALINAVYRGRGGGQWCGCVCYWLCYDARLPRWLGCHNAACFSSSAVGEVQGGDDAEVDGQSR